jgi:SAM-dependent methyltransferase
MSSLEHVDDVLRTVEEIHRILVPGGLLKIWVPHYSGPDAYRDLTHKTFFSYLTMDRFTTGASYDTPHKGMFTMVRRSLGLPDDGGALKAVPKWLANKFPEAYETYFCWIFPTKTMYYEMKANK